LSTIEDIKNKIDLLSYVRQFAPDVKQTGTNRYKCRCPLHDDSTPSFVLNADTGKWRCFGACATGGDVIDFARLKHGWDLATAIENLAKEAGVEIQRQGSRHKQRLYDALAAAAELYSQSLVETSNPARDHLEARGLGEALMSEFRLGYSPRWGVAKTLEKRGFKESELLAIGLLHKGEHGITELFRGRLIIPLFDASGAIVGFSGRSLSDDVQPKFLNTPRTEIFDRGSILYGYVQGKSVIRSTRSMVLVEGYFDVIQCHLAGYRDVVAQMGTQLTDAQAKLIGKSKTILALDGDKAGESATVGGIAQLAKTAYDLWVAELPQGADPDDLVKAGTWASAIAQAIPVVDYMIAHELRGNPQSFQERKNAALRLIELLSSSNHLERIDAQQKIALSLSLPIDSIRETPSIKQPVTIVAPVPDSHMLEQSVAYGYLTHHWYLKREFRSHNLRLLDRGDFHDPTLFSVVEQAIDQDALEPLEYVTQYYPDFVGDDTITPQDLLLMAAHLRLRSIDEILSELPESILEWVAEKAQVLELLSGTLGA